jgi:hypothetical protein
MLTKEDITILLDLLDTLSDYQATAGCNDYWLPKNWTPEETAKFEKDLKDYQTSIRDYEGAEDDEFPFIDDSALTYYLMAKLRKLREVL